MRKFIVNNLFKKKYRNDVKHFRFLWKYNYLETETRLVWKTLNSLCILVRRNFKKFDSQIQRIRGFSSARVLHEDSLKITSLRWKAVKICKGKSWTMETGDITMMGSYLGFFFVLYNSKFAVKNVIKTFEATLFSKTL